MTLGNRLHKPAQNSKHVAERLTGIGINEERDEIHGVTGVERDANLGVSLEAANAWAMPGAWIKDDHRRLLRIDTVIPASIANLSDAQQRVVGWLLEPTAIK